VSQAIEDEPGRRAPASEQLRILLGEQLVVLHARDAGVRLGADPEDLKRFRIAARRARALIRVTRRFLDGRLAELEAELRWLGGVLGPVRDLDVLLDHLRGLGNELGESGATVLALLEEEREQARAEMLAALESARYAELLTLFANDLESLAASPVHIRLGRLARAERKRLRGAYAALGAVPGDDELHSLRLKVKRARYSTELAARKRSEDVLRPLKSLQDVIGAHQDSVVAERRLRSLAEGRAELAVEPIIEIEQARRQQARGELAGAWKRMRREL
jgi:CHAD domain-containing protein